MATVEYSTITVEYQIRLGDKYGGYPTEYVHQFCKYLEENLPQVCQTYIPENVEISTLTYGLNSDKKKYLVHLFFTFQDDISGFSRDYLPTLKKELEIVINTWLIQNPVEE